MQSGTVFLLLLDTSRVWPLDGSKCSLSEIIAVFNRKLIFVMQFIKNEIIVCMNVKCYQNQITNISCDWKHFAHRSCLISLHFVFPPSKRIINLGPVHISRESPELQHQPVGIRVICGQCSNVFLVGDKHTAHDCSSWWMAWHDLEYCCLSALSSFLQWTEISDRTLARCPHCRKV